MLWHIADKARNCRSTPRPCPMKRHQTLRVLTQIGVFHRADADCLRYLALLRGRHSELLSPCPARVSLRPAAFPI